MSIGTKVSISIELSFTSLIVVGIDIGGMVVVIAVVGISVSGLVTGDGVVVVVVLVVVMTVPTSGVVTIR